MTSPRDTTSNTTTVHIDGAPCTTYTVPNQALTLSILNSGGPMNGGGGPNTSGWPPAW